MMGYLGWELGVKKILKPESSTAMISPPTETAPPDEFEEDTETPWKDFGSVKIDTQPSGAKIFLNNEDTNLTSPTTLTKLRIGETYKLRV